MPNRVVLDNEEFPITPFDINPNVHFFGAFETREMEVSAHYLVLLMRKLGSWEAFSLGQINGFLNGFHKKVLNGEDFDMNGLCGPENKHNRNDWWPERGQKVPSDVFIAKEGENGLFFFTDAFILACYRASPVPRVRAITPKQHGS